MRSLLRSTDKLQVNSASMDELPNIEIAITAKKVVFEPEVIKRQGSIIAVEIYQNYFSYQVYMVEEAAVEQNVYLSLSQSSLFEARSEVPCGPSHRNACIPHIHSESVPAHDCMQ